MGGGWFGGGGGGSFIGPTGGGGGWFGGGGGGGGGGLDWGPGSGGIGQTGPSSFRNRFSPESTHGGGGGILGNLLDQTAGVIHGLPGAVETAAQTGWHSLHLGYQNKAEAGWSPEKNWQALLSMLDISHKGDKYNQLVADKSVPKSERGFGGLLSSGWWHDPNEFGGAVLTPQYEAAKSDVVHAKNRDWHYFYEHPLNPILDIATVASLGGKAALIGGESSLAARGALGATAKEVATTERLLTDGNYARVLNQARTVQGRIRQRAFDNWSMRHPDARFIGASARMVPFLQRIVNNEMVMAHLPLRTFQHLTRNLTDEETFAFHVVVEPVTLDDRITFFEEEIARRMAQIGEREKRLAKKPPKTRPRIPPAIRPLEKYLDNLKSQGVRDAIEHPRQEFIDALEAGGRLEALAGKVLTDAGELNDAARKARVEMPARVMEPPAPPPPPAPPTFSGPVLPPTRPMTGGTPKPVMFTVRVPHLFWLEHEGLRSKIEGAIAAGTHETGELGHAHRVGKPGRTDLRIRMDEQALQNLIQHAKSDTHKAGMKVSAKATLRKLKAQEHIIHDARDRVTQELQWRHKRGDHWRVEDSDITVRPTGPESTPYQVWKDEEPISDRSHRTLAEAKRAAEKWVDYRRKEATLEAAQTQRAAEVAAGTAEPDPFIDSLDNPAGHDAAARANAALNSGPSVADARGAAFEESPVPHPTEHLPNEGELGGGATYTREESPGPGEEVFTIRLPGADHHPPDGSRGTRYYHQGEVQVHITHDAAYIGNLNIAKPFRRTAIKPMIESIGEFLDHAKVTRIVHDPEGMTHEGLRLWGGMVRRAGTGKLGDWKIAGEGVSVGKRVGVYAPGEGRGDLHQVGGAVLVRDEPAGWFDQKKPEAPPEAPAASVSEATTPPTEETPPAAQTYELPERPAAETGMANVHGPMFPPHYRFPHMREGFTPGQFLSPQVERMLTPNTPLKQLRHNSGVLLTNALMITDPERVYGRDYLSTLRWQMIGLMKEHVLSKIARPLDPEMAATGFKPENWWYYLEKPVTIPRNVRMDAVLTHDRSVVDAVRRDEKLHDAAHGIVSKSLTDLLGPDAADKYTAERLSEMGVKMIPAAYGKHFRDEFTRTPKVIRMLYDRPMDVWRAITLNYRPAWLVNNFIGNGVMGLATYGPKGLAAYLRVLLSVEKSDEVFKLWGKTTRIPKLQRKFGEAFDEVAAQLHSAGLFGTQTHITHRGIHEGAMANLFDQKAMRLVDATAGELGRQVLRVGRGITKAEILFAEDTSREASFLVEAGADIKRLQETARKMGEGNISEIEALKRMDKASVERAVERVNDALGDFNNLNHFERTIVRRIIPFYSWFKVITKVSAKYLARYPARVLLMKNIAEARDASTDALLPRWLEGALGIGGVSKAGNQTVITTNGLNPYETLPQIQSGGWASLLTPVGGSALISASGRDPSFGAARDYYGLGASKDFGWKGDTTRFFGSLIQNLAPFQTAEKAHDYKGKLYAPHNYHAGPVTVDDFWLQYFGLPIRHIRTGEARRERGLR